MQPTSPQISFFLFDGGEMWAWSSVMLASSCANLQTLKCFDVELSLQDAQTCIRVLPGGIVNLELAAPTAMVDDMAWQGLQKLTSLVFKSLEREPKPHIVHSGRGLTSLIALECLHMRQAEALEPLQAWIDGPNFFQKTLQTLTIQGRDPFLKGLSLTHFPALIELSLRGTPDIPSWVEDQPWQMLDVDNQLGWISVTKERLSMRGLRVSSPPPAFVLLISDLLLMPHLQSLQIYHREAVSRRMTFSDESWRTPVNLKGTYQEHQALLGQIDLTVDCPTQLGMTYPALGNSCLSLRRNGHTLICQCTSCWSLA